MKLIANRFAPLLLCWAATLTIPANHLQAEIVSFNVDPALFDDNIDGFITDTEFDPFGSDGTPWTFTPTNNLVGGDRLFLSVANGLHYGGGGGSTLSFDFSVNQIVTLESYTLDDSGFFLGNPIFNIEQGASVLSANNTSNNSGDTHSFNGGSIDLIAGTTYSFETQVSGAGVQAFMSNWTYSNSAVPEPSSCLMLTLAGLAFCVRRRKS